MICRKCGAELPDNTIRCANCGIKVNMLCPKCKTLNPFGEKRCKSCGAELIKTCDNCGASNIYSAKNCRKCGFEFNQEKELQETNFVRPISCSEENAYNEKLNTIPLVKVKQGDDILHEFFSADTTEQTEEIIQESNSEPLSDSKEEIDNNINNSSVEETQFDNEKNIEATDLDDELLNSTDKTELRNSTEINSEVSEIQQTEEIITEEQVQKQQEEEKKEQKQEINPIDEEEQEEINEENLIDENIEIEPIEEYIDENTQYEEDVQNENEQEEQSYIIKKEAADNVINLIKNSLDKNIIALNGPEGSGKTAVINQVTDILSQNGYIFLKGSCTPLSQITSFGFFQDAFLRIMGFPPYTNNVNSFIKDFKKSKLADVFSFLSSNELSLFLNIFYPSQTDCFENILLNKQQMFSILEKVIKSLLVNSNVIIAIDNFELLDGASYDFLIYMLDKNSFNNRLKLLTAYEEDKSIQSYFNIKNTDDKIYETIFLKKFDNEEIFKAVSSTIGIEVQEILNKDLLNKLLEISNGNALRLEQEIALLFDTNYIEIKEKNIKINEGNKPDAICASFEELIKLRINMLPPSSKNVLFMAAIMGFRFSTAILSSAISMTEQSALDTINYLKQNLFFNVVDNFTCEFKSLTLWKLTYKEAQADLLYKENSQRLYLTLKPLTLSSNLQKLISCTEAISKTEAFNIWKNTGEITAKLGDTNLFVIAGKQCLKILEEQEIPNSEEIKAGIYEQIGKLLYEKSPNEAVTYLANVLDNEIKEENINKVIDLSGYFIQSCYLTGNYFGVTEVVDAIISKLPNKQVSDLECALIKTRKLKALLNIGNSEQIINLVQEEILPELDKALSQKGHDSLYNTLIIDARMKASITLARAFALQGNKDAFNEIIEIRQFIEKYNYKSSYYYTQLEIIEAFANTMAGKINNSNNILDNINNKYKDRALAPNLLAEWNLIKIINRILTGQDNDLKADLFELAAFSNNINEHFLKNIIKLILGYILKEEGNTKKALDIFNEEITYFAKEKVAIGAMLSWAFMVKLSIETNDIDKALNTASKSLEIAQSPKINNYFFIIYFEKFLAEIYLQKGDLTAVKMYLEKAIMLAKQQELKFLLTELYIDYAIYMQEFMKSKQQYKEEFIKLTLDMCEKALAIAKELNISHLTEKAGREKSSFKTFCQLNSIEV